MRKKMLRKQKMEHKAQLVFACLLVLIAFQVWDWDVSRQGAIKAFLSQTSFLVAFVSDPGLDATPPASTHELTIPNDVS